MSAALRRLVRRVLTAEIAYIRAAVAGCVRVQYFLVKSRLGNTDAVTLADDGRGIENYEEQIFGLLAVTREGEDAVIRVVGVNPLETLPIEIDLMQGWPRGQQSI